MQAARNQSYPEIRNVEVLSKSIKWDEVLFIMLKGAILNEVMISNIPNKTVAIFIQKDTSGHAKGNLKKHTNNRRLNVSHLVVQDVSKRQTVSILKFLQFLTKVMLFQSVR